MRKIQYINNVIIIQYKIFKKGTCMQSSEKYSQILKDCFWDYNFKSSDIESMASSDDEKEKKFLFGKLLGNSTQMLKNMEIFDKNSLRYMIEEYQIPTFNHDYIARRLNMLEYYFLNKTLTVSELKWTA